jgi:cobalt-precorrin-5B (C1)-methyltransferase
MSGLREGFTTGTCAAAAAKAAVLLLTGKRAPKQVEVTLPGGERVALPVLYARKKRGAAEAAVRKDAGDDPDITDGAAVVACLSWREDDDIILVAGEGVGTVTKQGLSIPPGEPAVNPVPRRMIRDALREITERGVQVTLSIPGGEALAARTFNPRLGIAGGLSILGTSGRVRPFSCPALRASLVCLLDVAVSSGVSSPVFVPGRIGERAARRHFRLGPEQVIEVGNEWGFILDCAGERGFKALLILGHPGKLAKLAAGEWDTHSSRSKSAVPWIADLTAKILGRPLPDMPTAEGLFSVLDKRERKRVGNTLAGRIRRAVEERIGNKSAVSTVLVDMKGEIIGTDGDLKQWLS